MSFSFLLLNAQRDDATVVVPPPLALHGRLVTARLAEGPTGALRCRWDVQDTLDKKLAEWIVGPRSVAPKGRSRRSA